MPTKLAEARRVIAFDVLGTPAPKGSARIAHFGGRAVLVPNSSTKNAREQRQWHKAIKTAAIVWMRDNGYAMFARTALYVSIVFYVKRPKSAKNRPRPSTKPDLDKYARCSLDALSGIVFDDDGRIADLVVSKRWAEPGCEGARITVTEAVVL